MEFVWRPFEDSLGNSSQIFTHAMYNTYFSPPGLGWDTLDGGDPFVDDPYLETFNADYLCNKLSNYLVEMKQSYRTNHLMIPMGADFNYQDAKMDF